MDLGCTVAITTVQISYKLYKTVQEAAEVDEYAKELLPCVKLLNQLAQDIHYEVGDHAPEVVRLALQALKTTLESVQTNVLPVAELAKVKKRIGTAIKCIVRSGEHREIVMEARRKLQEVLQQLGVALQKAQLHACKVVNDEAQQSLASLRLQLDTQVVGKLDEIKNMLHHDSDQLEALPRLMELLQCNPAQASVPESDLVEDVNTLQEERDRLGVRQDSAKEAAVLELVIQALQSNAAPQAQPTELKSDSFKARSEAIADLCVCPITLQTMTDPVMLVASGITYERSAILRWLQKQDKCPVSGTLLRGNHQVRENFLIRQLLDQLPGGSTRQSALTLQPSDEEPSEPTSNLRPSPMQHQQQARQQSLLELYDDDRQQQQPAGGSGGSSTSGQQQRQAGRRSIFELGDDGRARLSTWLRQPDGADRPHGAVPPSGRYQIFAKELESGKQYAIQIHALNSVAALKSKIQAVARIPPEQQRLVYQGQQLKDGYTVGHHGVQPDSVVHIVSPSLRR